MRAWQCYENYEKSRRKYGETASQKWTNHPGNETNNKQRPLATMLPALTPSSLLQSGVA